MQYTQEQLEYFEQLIKGTAEISWRAWWKKNDKILKEQLPKPEYSRIRFGLVKYAHKVLSESGNVVPWSPAASREQFYANHHESVLDEKGRPTKEHRMKMYGGALAELSAGNKERATKKIKKEINEALKNREEHQCDNLDAIQYDAEMMVNYGVDSELGYLMSQVIAKLEETDDIIGPAIQRAKEVLSKQSVQQDALADAEKRRG